MAKYRAKIKDCQLIIKVKLSRGEAYEEQILSAFSRKCIRGLLRVRSMKSNMIEYIGPQGITMKEFLAQPIKKSDFFFILEQFVILMRRIQSENLNENWIVWDMNWIFYNETTREVQFMYLPYQEIPIGNSLMNLLDTMVYSSKTENESDVNYISRFICMLRECPYFDVVRVESFIKKEDPDAVKTLRHHGTGQSGFISDKKIEHYEHYKEKEDEDNTSILGMKMQAQESEEDEKTTVLRHIDSESEETGILSDISYMEDEEEATCLLEKTPVYHYPILYRLSTQEEVLITKTVFLIGKRKENCCYILPENDKISRSHAAIVTREKSYFVMDVGSKNGTFINDERIPVNQEVEVKDGDTIRLANEEFEFRV